MKYRTYIMTASVFLLLCFIYCGTFVWIYVFDSKMEHGVDYVIREGVILEQTWRRNSRYSPWIKNMYNWWYVEGSDWRSMDVNKQHNLYGLLSAGKEYYDSIPVACHEIRAWQMDERGSWGFMATEEGSGDCVYVVFKNGFPISCERTDVGYDVLLDGP